MIEGKRFFVLIITFFLNFQLIHGQISLIPALNYIYSNETNNEYTLPAFGGVRRTSLELATGPVLVLRDRTTLLQLLPEKSEVNAEEYEGKIVVGSFTNTTAGLISTLTGFYLHQTLSTLEDLGALGLIIFNGDFIKGEIFWGVPFFVISNTDTLPFIVLKGAVGKNFSQILEEDENQIVTIKYTDQHVLFSNEYADVWGGIAIFAVIIVFFEFLTTVIFLFFHMKDAERRSSSIPSQSGDMDGVRGNNPLRWIQHASIGQRLVMLSQFIMAIGLLLRLLAHILLVCMTAGIFNNTDQYTQAHTFFSVANISLLLVAVNIRVLQFAKVAQLNKIVRNIFIVILITLACSCIIPIGYQIGVSSQRWILDAGMPELILALIALSSIVLTFIIAMILRSNLRKLKSLRGMKGNIRKVNIFIIAFVPCGLLATLFLVVQTAAEIDLGVFSLLITTILLLFMTIALLYSTVPASLVRNKSYHSDTSHNHSSSSRGDNDVRTPRSSRRKSSNSNNNNNNNNSSSSGRSSRSRRRESAASGSAAVEMESQD